MKNKHTTGKNKNFFQENLQHKIFYVSCVIFLKVFNINYFVNL